jgi:hypothetical protein
MTWLRINVPDLALCRLALAGTICNAKAFPGGGLDVMFDGSDE